jgi:hypothetical protein
MSTKWGRYVIANVAAWKGVIGGELAAADGVLLHAVCETIDQRTSPAAGHPYKVVRGALSDKAEVLGAVALAMVTAASGQLEQATA